MKKLDGVQVVCHQFRRVEACVFQSLRLRNEGTVTFPKKKVPFTKDSAQSLPACHTKMPSLTELISSIKANSSANSFLAQPKKRKQDEQPLPEKKKSRTS
jgi:hypothetical protein